MYLRYKTVAGHDYLFLVESYRENGKVKQRVHKCFGRRDRLDLENLRSQLARCPGFAMFRAVAKPRADVVPNKLKYDDTWALDYQQEK